MPIPENSTVCFIGDSITAAEKYTRILIDFFVLHYPDRHVRFHNVGVPGTRASHALRNWETLVESRRPTHAIVMFGMNDLQRSLYADSARETEELLAKRESKLGQFEENLRDVLDRLQNIPYLVMTPTPHDESTALPLPLYRGYDAMLKKASAMITEKFSPVLDLHTPLYEVNEMRLVDTIIGPDRVHPGNIGHAIMAYHILKKLGFENPRLPLGDESFTESEKAVLARLGIIEDPAPKNPYSDERSRIAKRITEFYYIEMNELYAQGIPKEDTEKADAYLREQLTKPVEQWRKDAYVDYMANRHLLPERECAVMEAMDKMYRA